MRRSPLRTRRISPAPDHSAAAFAWRQTVRARGCEICPQLGEACEGDVQAHHLLRQQTLRRYVAAVAHEKWMSAEQQQELENRLLWDPANGLATCYRAHRRHHNRTQPIPLALVPFPAIRFAAGLGLAHVIEREYA